MKLTDQEITAIACKVHNKKKEEYNKSTNIEREKQRKKHTIEARKYVKLLNQLPNYLTNYITRNEKSVLNAIINNQCNSIIQMKESLGDIKNDIILALIDTKDLNELKKKLKIDF